MEGAAENLLASPQIGGLGPEIAADDPDAIIVAYFCLLAAPRTGGPSREVPPAKGRKEITEKLRPDLVDGIIAAKLAERQTVDEEKHAARVCSLTAKRTRPDRLVDTRFVLAIKGDADGKEIAKARWVARGFKDPDALKLDY